MKAKDILLPHKKKAKHLWSGKSYGDLNYATSDGDSATIPQLSSHDNPQRRSLSFGSGSAQLAAQRVAIGAEYPHDAMAYELLSKCGYGATAEVWRARCKPLGEEVAIKIVNLEKAGQCMETIMQEAQLLCKLRHANILPLLACFTRTDALWMVLPFVQGGSVESAMKYAFPKGLPEKIIAPIVYPILKALAYLHKHDIAHRDVKASNILLDRNNILLGDFGTAVEMERILTCNDKKSYGQYLTRKTYVGTPHWMAPEVIEQCEAGHGTKADIYSFGVTLLEMACGKAPFAGLPLEVVAMNKLHHPSPCLPASYEGRNFSAEMQDVVASCLEKEPHKRPSADQLLKHRFFKWVKSPKPALEDLLNGVPGPVQRLSSLTRRSTEQHILTAGEEAASYPADERVSLNSLKSKEAQWATRFDADTALNLLNKMLAHPTTEIVLGESPETSNFGRSFSAINIIPGSQAQNRRLSFSKRKSFPARGLHWPTIPPVALKFCRGILFASASKKGFGLQTMWGHGFMMAHISLPGGKQCWSGPCYCYISGNTHVGVGDTTRESVVLYSGKSFKERVSSGVAFKLSGMQLRDAVEDHLGTEGICSILKDESSSCEGVAFRHYTGSKAWKSVPGIVHVDHAANEKLYGKLVSPAEILEGKLPPPLAFRNLIDVLNAAEDGKYIFKHSDGDSDESSQGIARGLERDLDLQSIGSAMSGIKLGGSPGTTPQEGDNAFAEEMSPRYNVPSPPPSIFAQGQLYNLPECCPRQEDVAIPPADGLPDFQASHSDPIFTHGQHSYPRWDAPISVEDDDGTPPPDHMLQGQCYSSATDGLSMIRTAGSDASTISKLESQSIMENAIMAFCEDADRESEAKHNKFYPPDDKWAQIGEDITRLSPFATNTSQDAMSPCSELKNSEFKDPEQRLLKPPSPMSTTLKPPKHPRSLSASLNGLKF